MQATIVAKDAAKAGADDLAALAAPPSTTAGHTAIAGDAVEEEAPPAEMVS